MYVVEVIDLWKRFGERDVLKGVSFNVREGEIYGIVGPNGAGKTTTLRILATLLKPDRGDAVIYGKSVTREAGSIRKQISYLPEDAGIYKHLTGIEFLRINGMLYGLKNDVLEEALEFAVKISGLGEELKKPMGSYSKGMKRRIMVARTLMTKSKLLVLDEPTSGLDVEHAVYVRKVVREYVKNMSATCIVSSHNMLEIEYLCDRVGFMKDGRILLEGEPRNLKKDLEVENLEEAFMKVVGR
ncbi:MAG: ABC transporter ATP-binding protein [Nitrososphaerota archaeon]|nr:ABC transporter ATP-binding protein [Candidatus Geocrenenecus dongiae]